MARLPLRWKMTLGILISFILVLPVVALSLYFLRDILQLERRIIEVLGARQADARAMVQRVEALGRAETLYLITREDRSRTDLREHLAVLEEIAARSPAGQDPYGAPLRTAQPPLERYRASLDSLVRIIEVEKNVDPYRDAEVKVRRFREELDRVLARADREADPVRRQEHFHRAQEFLRSFENALLAMETRDDPQKAALVHDLQGAREEVRRVAEQAEGDSTSEIDAQRRRIASLSNRARKNIFSMILVTALLGLAWILVLPRRIAVSIHRITNLLRRGEQGNLNLPRAPEGSDELGELGFHLNRFLDTVRQYDRLKAERIREADNRLRALAAAVEEVVLFVDDSFRIVFANDRLPAVFGREPDDAQRTLAGNPDLQTLIRGVLRDGEEASRKRLTLTTGDGTARGFQVACNPVRDHRGEVRQVLISLKPLASPGKA
ncbi:MAG: PAS domain-containing protein [Acidobacteria bacterium]|nr:PAS domain-containing protein [Acidobacteriota bacterium]